MYDCTWSMFWKQHWTETAFSGLCLGAAVCKEGLPGLSSVLVMNQPYQMLTFLCLPSLSCVRNVWDSGHQGGFLLQDQTLLQRFLLQKLLLKLQEGQHPGQTASESKHFFPGMLGCACTQEWVVAF